MISFGIQVLLLLGAALPISSLPTSSGSSPSSLMKRRTGDLSVAQLPKEASSLYQCGEGGVSVPYGTLLEHSYTFCNEMSHFANAWPSPMPIGKTIVVNAQPYYKELSIGDVKVEAYMFNLKNENWDVTVNECYALANALVTGCPDGLGGSRGGKVFQNLNPADASFGQRGMGLELRKA